MRKLIDPNSSCGFCGGYDLGTRCESCGFGGNRERNDMKEYFEQQIEGGATDQFFYGTKINGEVRIERHRGTIDSLTLTGLEFDRMMGSTPFFRPCSTENL
jgi:hypothetical protein